MQAVRGDLQGSINPASDTVVELIGVRRTFGSVAALDGVDLRVQRGENLVLLGRSGSGKSTLLRTLNGLERTDAGRVLTLGQDVGTLRRRELRALRSRVGFVFQNFELVGSLTAIENVLAGALHRCRGPRLGLVTYGRQERYAALERLDEVGMLDHAYRRADTLSGGQRQRVALARALMQEPELILADETVASLDPETAQTVMALIKRIADDRDLTVICTLHQVDLAMEWGDRIVGLRAGRPVLDTAGSVPDRARIMRLYGPAEDAASDAFDALAVLPEAHAVGAW